MRSPDYLLPLKQYLKTLNIALNDLAFHQFKIYLELLQKWGSVINLTAHTAPEKIVSYHFLDSLSVMPFVVNMSRLCDVGSGAGVPGIPLAIACPQLSLTLVEASQKKCHFLQQVIRSCDLKNVSVISKRVECFKPLQPFDGVITRAYANLAEMLQQTTHLCDNGGLFLAMKAKVSEKELGEVPNSFLLKDAIALNVPGFSHRTLYIYTQPLTQLK